MFWVAYHFSADSIIIDFTIRLLYSEGVGVGLYASGIRNFDYNFNRVPPLELKSVAKEGEFPMRRRCLLLGLISIAFLLFSCADSEPTEQEMLEILASLETSINSKDVEGVVALFAEDAVWDESYKNQAFTGIENVAFNWEIYFITPVTSEFKDISVDGDTATFTWIESRPAFNKIWPNAFIEVKNGKIARIEWPEDAIRELTGEE